MGTRWRCKWARDGVVSWQLVIVNWWPSKNTALAVALWKLDLVRFAPHPKRDVEDTHQKIPEGFE